MSENNSFAELVGEVIPNTKPNQANVNRRSSKAIDAKSQKHKRQSAETNLTSDLANTASAIKASPEQRLQYSRTSLDKASIRKLNHGQFAIEGILDLHGHTIARAQQQVWQMLHDAYERELKCVLIIHGKGGQQKKPDSDTIEVQTAIIKTHCAQWLQGFDFVLGYCSAKPRDGGTGALYVLLKRKRG